MDKTFNLNQSKFATINNLNSLTSLHQLTKTADALRNEPWETSFFKALSEGSLDIISMDPQYGPDRWPYLFTQTSPQGGKEPFQKILQWLSQRGIGLVVNAQKKLPDYIFTYGMIWHFKETGYFFLNINEPISSESSERFEFSTQDLKYWGQPTENFLPKYVRKTIRDFFQQQSVLLPKVLMLSLDGKKYELAFSLESLGNPPISEHASIAEALSWFLPPHYSILLVSEQNLPTFEPLYCD